MVCHEARRLAPGTLPSELRMYARLMLLPPPAGLHQGPAGPADCSGLDGEWGTPIGGPSEYNAAVPSNTDRHMNLHICRLHTSDNQVLPSTIEHGTMCHVELQCTWVGSCWLLQALLNTCG
jgi:hypothetical protein